MSRASRRHVISIFVLSAAMAAGGCSATRVETVKVRRPHHRIDAVAFLPGAVSESMAAAVDSQRFTVFGPEETEALMKSVGVTSWPVPPRESACRALASAGVDVVVSTRSVSETGWCAWELYALAHSTQTCGLVASVMWCAEDWGGLDVSATGGDSTRSAEAVRVGRDLGHELSTRLRQVSAP